MNYASELKKFITSQYIYSGVRIALAIVIPCIILAHFGLLKTYFLFPLGTSFLGLTDMPGPFIRRRNALLLAIFGFLFVSLVAGLLKDYPFFIFIEIITFGLFFTMLGIYGQRLAAVGSLILVVFAIFIDGTSGNHPFWQGSVLFILGSIWYFVIFLSVSVLRPYKLAQQMIGENYIELGNYLKVKSQFYEKNPDFDELFKKVFALQVRIKEHQEATREVVFKTRKIVNESTTTSRVLMMLFLNSLDLYEKLLTSQNDYRKLHEYFDGKEILEKINEYLNKISSELINLGISVQSGIKTSSEYHISSELEKLHEEYFNLRNRELNAETLEKFMVLRQILKRISEISEEIIKINRANSQDIKLAKSLSTGLDLEKFVPKEEKLNCKIFFQNFTLKSNHFRHAIRLTLSLIIGYAISKIEFLHINKTFWILITILAIMRPAYSITKHRNLLRLYGTIGGAIVGISVIYLIPNPNAQFIIFLLSLILTFSLLKDQYSWAVFFMTIYIFLTFNFLKPGNFEEMFKERLIDTIIAGSITFLVSYSVFPVWEHTKNRDFMVKFIKSNTNYFDTIISLLQENKISIQDYKIRRKEAVVSLANLSDSFQRMLSEPKNQQKNLESIHQFVTTSHLFTAYSASLSQYAQNKKNYKEIDFENWKSKIDAELLRTETILKGEKYTTEDFHESKLKPEDLVNEMLEKRKMEISENEFFDRRDVQRVSYLTELKNIQELLELIYDVAKDQRKIAQNLEFETNS